MYSFLFIMFLSMDIRAFIFNGVTHIFYYSTLASADRTAMST